MLFRQGSFCYSAFIKIGVLNDKRIKKTPLYETYVNSGAKIVEFGGWAMPVQFTSIKEEHNAVRYKVGMFDVSHMGEILKKVKMLVNLFNIYFRMILLIYLKLKLNIQLYVMMRVVLLMI